MFMLSINNTVSLRKDRFHDDCIIRSSKDGKETSWSVFRYMGNNFLYAYVKYQTFPVTGNLILEHRRFNGFSREDFGRKWRPLQSGHYYISFGVSEMYKHDVAVTIDGNYFDYSRITQKQKRASLSTAQRSRGFIADLDSNKTISYRKFRFQKNRTR